MLKLPETTCVNFNALIHIFTGYWRRVTDTASNFIINTQHCKIPDIDPFNPCSMRFIRNWSPNMCSPWPPLVESNETHFWINTSHLPLYNIRMIEELQCCYRNFSRVNNAPYGLHRETMYQ